MEKTVFISLPLEDLESLIKKCVDACLKANSLQSPITSEDKILSVAEAADFLNLKIPTIYSLVSQNELPVMKRSKRLYFSTVELTKYIKEGRKQTNSEIQQAADNFIQSRKQ